MSSPADKPNNSKVVSRTERRREYYKKNKEVLSKLRDRATLSKKENEQQRSQLAQIKVDQSRGFRTSTLITRIASASPSPRPNHVKVPPAAKPGFLPTKHKRKVGRPNPKENKKKAGVRAVSKAPPPSSKAREEKVTVKPEMSEISMNARGVELSSEVNHLPQKYVLFIGNLPYSINKGQLMVHFRKTGGVKSIRIPKDKTGNGKGFAYLELKDRISHGMALRLHHTTLGGRRINVEFSNPHTKKQQEVKSVSAPNT